MVEYIGAPTDYPELPPHYHTYQKLPRWPYTAVELENLKRTDREQTDNREQITENSITEATLIPCGSLG